MSDFIVDEGFFRTKGGFVKARLEYDEDPLNPWEMWDRIGHLLFNNNRYKIGDEYVEDWREYFYGDTPDLTEEDYENLNITELYNRWKDSKEAVVPVCFADYGCNGCRLTYTEDEDNIYIDSYGYLANEGFYVVEKGNKEVIDNGWSKKDLINCMCGELYEYAKYLEGDVYCIWWSEWNKDEMYWEEEDCCGGITFPEDLKYSEQLKYALQEVYCNVYERVYEGQINYIQEHLTDGYIKYIKDELIISVNNMLREFDNLPKYALKHVLLEWCKTEDYNRDRALCILFEGADTLHERACLVSDWITEWRVAQKL